MADIIIYNTADGKVSINLYADNNTVWLTQAQIAELFDKERSGISKHIKNIFSENELDEKSNVNYLHIANSDKPVTFYSLEVILAVGFRVRSPRGTQFRQWANSTLKEYLLKGFVMDDERLKILTDGPTILTNYWNVFAIFVPVKNASIKSCVIFSHFQAIISLTKTLLNYFLQKHKINLSTALQDKLQQS